MITTPFYQEALQDNCVPLEKYPDLVLVKKPNFYERPLYYLSICPKADQNLQYFYLHSVVQNNIQLPPWKVGVNPKEYQNKSSDILCKYLADQFPYQTNAEEEKIIIDEKGQTPPQSMTSNDILNEMKTKNYSIKCTLSDSELKIVNYRSQIVKEILSSEETYVSQLEIIRDVIIPQFKKNKIFLDEDYSKFNIITNMIQVHSQFLTNLKSAGSSFDANLSSVFLNFCDYFKIVKPYIKSLDSIYETMGRTDKGKIDQIVKSEPRLNGMAPMSYFIVPFQRVPKYPLFLRDLIKNTPSFHPDSIFLNLAFDSIKVVLDNIEYSKEAAEEQEKLYNIFNRISKKVNLLDPRRRLLDQFNVMIKSSGTKGIFYVFNDLVLLTSLSAPNPKQKTEETAVYNQKIVDFKYLDQLLEIDTISFHLGESNCIVEFMNSDDTQNFKELIEKNRMEKFKEMDQNEIFLIEKVQIGNQGLHVYGHDSVALKSNMFSFGGTGIDSFATNVNSIFDPVAKSYNIFIPSDGPSARTELSLATDDDNKIFLFGGKTGSEFFNDLYIGTFKGNNNIEWKKADYAKSDVDPPEARAGHTLVYHNNGLFLFGGYQKERVFNDLYIYTLKDNKWHKPNADSIEYCSSRFYHSACKCGNLMVIHAGRNQQQVLNDTCFFDMNQKKWIFAKINGDPLCRYGHKSFYLNGFFIIIGGTDEKKGIVQPSIIDCTKDKEWNCRNLKMAGNDPTTLFLFSIVYLNDSDFYAYGGIDSMTLDNISNCLQSLHQQRKTSSRFPK